MYGKQNKTCSEWQRCGVLLPPRWAHPGRSYPARIPPAKESISSCSRCCVLGVSSCRCAVRPLKSAAALAVFLVDPAGPGAEGWDQWPCQAGDRLLLTTGFAPSNGTGDPAGHLHRCVGCLWDGRMSLLASSTHRALFLWHFLRFCSTSIWRHHRHLLIVIFSSSPRFYLLSQLLFQDVHPILFHPNPPTRATRPGFTVSSASASIVPSQTLANRPATPRFGAVPRLVCRKSTRTTSELEPFPPAQDSRTTNRRRRSAR